MFKSTNCDYCGKWFSMSRSDQKYCRNSCRVAGNRFKKKMAAAGISVPDPNELERATAVVSMDVFRRDMSVIEALEKGYIKVEYQPRLIRQKS